MKVQEHKIVLYKLNNGQVPFERWFNGLGSVFQQAVDARISRLMNGNLGDHRSLGGGLCELRINKGPGLRVYYGFAERQLVVLILGGNKGSQSRDIKKARRIWLEIKP